MKPVCVPCRCFYRPKETGFSFIEGMPLNSERDIRGNRSPGSWTPYKLWSGDLWECPDCGAEIIVGVASAAISEHYLPDFHDQVSAYSATLQVNDC